jgi:Family of unknown function (DUF6152)
MPVSSGENLVSKSIIKSGVGRAVTVLALATAVAGVAVAHHSFSVYNNEVVKVFTRVNPDANHLQIFFAPMNAEHKNVMRGADGKPLVWAVEMGGSAQAAAQGISVSAFTPGTIFSVGMHPLRSGEQAGSREGNLYKCPAKKPPPVGKHCDSVPGGTKHGEGTLAVPKG